MGRRDGRLTIDVAEQMLYIDADDLDTEVIQQPLKYWQVSSALVEAAEAKDSASDEKERVYADLMNKYRQQLKDEKPTETRLKSEVANDERYQEVQEEYLAARNVYEQWNAMREAFYQRSMMLRELVRMVSSNYSQSDSMGPEQQRNRQMLAESRNKKLRQTQTSSRSRRARRIPGRGIDGSRTTSGKPIRRRQTS